MEAPETPGLEPDQPAVEFHPQDISPGYPAPAHNNNKKILIILLAVILLCCLCLTLAGGAFTAYRVFFVDKTSKVEVLETEAAQVLVPTAAARPTATRSVPIIIPTSRPEKPQASGSNLGVSRQEMMDFFEAFEFEEPFTAQGVELVMGYHTWLCVAGDCAAVTLLGPKGALDAVSVAVPSDPGDESVGLVGSALLMTTAGYFAGDESEVPFQIMEAIENARSGQQYKETTFTDEGYIFTVSFDPQSGIAGLAVSR